MHRAAGVAALFLVLAAPARAATLGLAEVRGSDGTLIGRAGAGAYAYPTDGSVIRIGRLPAKGLMCGQFARKKSGARLSTPCGGAELIATAARA